MTDRTKLPMTAERIAELRAACKSFDRGEASALSIAGLVPELLDACEAMLSRAIRPTRMYVDPPPTSQKDWVIEDIKVGNYAAPKTDKPKEVPDPRVHAPRLTRTLMDGPGNHTDIRGCVCGAKTFGAEAYAAHIGWSVEAVRALLAIVGFADDALRYPNGRNDLWQKINRSLEVRSDIDASASTVAAPAVVKAYSIRADHIEGPNLRMTLGHVIELLHMRHDVDPRALPTVSMMGAIEELIALLNGAYEQGRSIPTGTNERV